MSVLHSSLRRSRVHRLGVFSIAGVLALACSSAPSDPSSTGGATTTGTGTGGATGTGATGTAAGVGGATGAGVGGATGAGVGGAATGSGGTTGGATGAGGTTGGTGSGGSTTFLNDVWIATDGDDFTGTGSETQPFKSLLKALEGISAGKNIWVKPGTYAGAATIQLQVSGTEAAPITISAAPGGARPVFDFALQQRNNGDLRGFVVQGNYWHIKGIDIINASDNGMLVRGSYNVIENVVFHHNGDTGLQITVSEGAEGNPELGKGNLILNCDSYENIDEATSGENADGFAAKERIGAGNIFRGCRAWNNADDGYDFFAADDVVTVENCWAFLNGIATSGSNPSGDGNGFKLGGEPDGPGQGHAPHVVTGSSAFDNKKCGFTRNNNDDSPVLSDCGIGNNDGGDYCGGLSACTPEHDVSTSGSAAKSIARNPDGSLPPLD